MKLSSLCGQTHCSLRNVTWATFPKGSPDEAHDATPGGALDGIPYGALGRVPGGVLDEALGYPAEEWLF